MRVTHSAPSPAIERGIALCREGEWDKGLFWLGRVAESGESSLPGLFYSYLGYGIARCQRRHDEGLKLCQHSIKIEFYEPDNYLNLARTCLLLHDRTGAVRAVRKGLKVDPEHLDLKALYRELGIRRPPVLPFLPRGQLLNRLLGRVRSALHL
jgi:tetratricopeptide (TPR) repeat protein